MHHSIYRRLMSMFPAASRSQRTCLLAEGYGLARDDPLLQASLTTKDAKVGLSTIDRCG
ncbi:MAG: hypothetical protein LH628_19710 [Microcoleus sp. CAN_BIN18]|nr:hypothetical protein [Microcoleus sp. CAN_BIN18]